MSLFYLNLTRGNELLPNDPEPQEFTDLEAARIEAVASLRELSGHAILDGRASDRADGIDITDLDRALLLRVPAAD